LGQISLSYPSYHRAKPKPERFLNFRFHPDVWGDDALSVLNRQRRLFMCAWARGKADVLYVADAFKVMAKANALLAANA
jgi:hypothetical protein